MDIHLWGDGTGGGGVLDYCGIHQAAPEHGRTLNCYAITVRPVCGVRKCTGGESRDVVVETGGD